MKTNHEKYPTNSRVEYYVFRGIRKYHKVGYVKACRKSLFKARYIVCTADKVREVDEIRPKQILGLAPKKEFNKHSKSNDNGSF